MQPRTENTEEPRALAPAARGWPYRAGLNLGPGRSDEAWFTAADMLYLIDEVSREEAELREASQVSQASFQARVEAKLTTLKEDLEERQSATGYRSNMLLRVEAWTQTAGTFSLRSVLFTFGLSKSSTAYYISQLCTLRKIKRVRHGWYQATPA